MQDARFAKSASWQYEIKYLGVKEKKIINNSKIKKTIRISKIKYKIFE